MFKDFTPEQEEFARQTVCRMVDSEIESLGLAHNALAQAAVAVARSIDTLKDVRAIHTNKDQTDD